MNLRETEKKGPERWEETKKEIPESKRVCFKKEEKQRSTRPDDTERSNKISMSSRLVRKKQWGKGHVNM